MTATTDFDRRLSDWLAADGDPEAPAGLVPTAVALARETAQRRSPLDRLVTRLTWPAVGLPGQRSSPATFRTLAILALLAVMLAGALLVASGAIRLRPEPPTTPAFGATGDLAVEVGLPFTLPLADGTVLIADGLGLQRYDPTAGTFSQLPDTEHQIRGWAQANNDDLHLLRVEDEEAEPPGSGRSRVVIERLDPADIGDAARMATEIGRSELFFFQSVVALDDGRLVILGQDFGVEALVALVFDPESGTFERGGSTDRIVNGEHATLLSGGRILVIDQPTDSATMNVALYDAGAASFTSLGNLPSAWLFTTTVLTDGRVLVAGGGTTTPATGPSQPLDAAFVIDVENGTSTAVGPMPEARWMHAAARTADGRVLIAGGYVGKSRDPSASTLLFDAATGIFAAGPDLLHVRLNATAMTLADGRILIFGHTPLSPGGPAGPGLRAEVFGLIHEGTP